MSSVPLEPYESLQLTWSLLFLFSENESRKKIGQSIYDNFNKYIELHKDNQKQYLIHLANSIFSTLRILSYRVTGMEAYIKLYNNIEQKRLEELNNLSSITSKPASLLPRVISSIGGGAVLGSISITGLITKTANTIIPNYGPFTGYELFILFILFGSSIGYAFMEILIRIYRSYALRNILNETQYEKSIAWNRFVREAREAMRSLLIQNIKIKEEFFPNLNTYNGHKVFDSTNLINMKKFNDVLTSIIRINGPQVRNSFRLRPKILTFKSYVIKKFKIYREDLVSGSFASAPFQNVNYYYYESTSDNIKLDADTPIFEKKNVEADEFSFVAGIDGWGFLVFENPTMYNRLVSYSCEIIRKDLQNLWK